MLFSPRGSISSSVLLLFNTTIAEALSSFCFPPPTAFQRRHCAPASRKSTQFLEGAGANSLKMTTSPGKKIKDLTLVFCRREEEDGGCKQILLGKKKRGFGVGKWNGFGGKVEAGETIEQAAKRELLEESFVTAKELAMRGILIFNVPSYPSTMRVFVYEAVRYSGEPKESEEMQPKWFVETDLPFKEMWPDDAYWMPLFLAGKAFRGEFDYANEDTISRYTLTDLPSSEALLASLEP